MGKWKNVMLTAAFTVTALVPTAAFAAEEGETLETKQLKTRTATVQSYEVPQVMKRFTYSSDLSFDYPDAVRGIYVTGPSAGGARFDSLVKLVDDTDLNAMVIDIKDDHGNITYKPDKKSPYYDIAQDYIDDPQKMLKELEKHKIYPIARIVVFKDTLLAEKKPELSFRNPDGSVWKNGRGEAFVSPFQHEVWEYNVELAKEAAMMGFQEIQFDYVRFPEGFEKRSETLQYDHGDYTDSETTGVQKRVRAVTDFVAYAKEELANYDVQTSVDIFGYAATLKEAPGIGQNFSKISSNVDVISSMIYPSHWTSYFGIDVPNDHPYELTAEYAKVENEVLGKLENAPESRPWIQDFEAPWVSSKQYGKQEVEDQIRALNENGIDEFLIWNAGNSYTEGVDYTP
ncbi:putative glycoside hydrolase [Terribacillus sp. DMT04]|uniref:putative glycoside hydrolase n=1 Tax=Terribacillus sp. DMT04 TaxID=2850441 RepID=UPI001C2BFC62|nr:putative glycoside hydrolase [Terribacillus sp. DMT04]QXE02722.1 putative glycoside hydrolase [Terribacillus sp. DMT04]